MFAMAMAAVLATMAMLIFNVFRSRTVYDRILSINSFGTKTKTNVKINHLEIPPASVKIDVATEYHKRIVTAKTEVNPLKICRKND